MPTTTTGMAAESLGVTRQWISYLCEQHGIGTLINPRCRVLTPADVAKLRRLVGNHEPTKRKLKRRK